MIIKPVMKKFLLGILILACVACTMTISTEKTLPTVESLSETQVYISNQMATLETAIAQITAEALITPTIEPTLTATPTPIPTSTFAPLATFYFPPTSAPTLWPTWYFTATPIAYQCEVIDQSPNRKTLAPNEDFDARWTVVNTGSEDWDNSCFDYRFLSGTEMDKHGGNFDLPEEIQHDEKLNLIVDMTAPGIPGRYVTLWEIASGTVSACIMDLVIYVR